MRCKIYLDFFFFLGLKISSGCVSFSESDFWNNLNKLIIKSIKDLKKNIPARKSSSSFSESVVIEVMLPFLYCFVCVI
jgi:hypothetical protein